MTSSRSNLSETARIVKVTVGRVSQIVKEKREEWAAKNEVAAKEHIEVQLERLHRTYQQAERTYQRSLKDAKKVVTSSSANGESETVTLEGQAGDTAALGIKLRCIETALKLLGAFPKEEKTEVTNVVQINWAEFSAAIPCTEPLAVTPADEVEARIAAESIPSPNGQNGNGQH